MLPDLHRWLAAALAAAVALLTGVVLAAPARADVTVTIEVSSDRQVDHDLTVSGQVSGAMAGVVVTLQRQDPGGAPPQSVGSQTVDASGGYSFTDSPDARGSVTYTVTVQPSGPSNSATVNVAGLVPSLSLTAEHRVVPSGRRVSLTAHLAGPDDRHLTIDAKPRHRERRQIAAGDADAASGDLTTTYRVKRRTVFVVHYAGDSRYDAAAARAVVRARAVLLERLRGGYGTAGAYRLYHPGGDPTVQVQLRPALAHVCVYFRAQHYRGGRWHTRALSSCLHTDPYGAVAGELGGRHVVGEPYRLRAEWHGNRTALAAKGRWLKVKFHR